MPKVLVQQFYQDNGELFVELGGPREVNVTDAELDLLESAQEIICMKLGFYSQTSYFLELL